MNACIRPYELFNFFLAVLIEHQRHGNLLIFGLVPLLSLRSLCKWCFIVGFLNSFVYFLVTVLFWIPVDSLAPPHSARAPPRECFSAHLRMVGISLNRQIPLFSNQERVYALPTYLSSIAFEVWILGWFGFATFPFIQLIIPRTPGCLFNPLFAPTQLLFSESAHCTFPGNFINRELP